MKLEESPTVELKHQVVDGLQKDIIAFANTKGGSAYIVLSVFWCYYINRGLGSATNE